MSLIDHTSETIRSWLRVPRLRNEEVLCQENIDFLNFKLDYCLNNCHPLASTGFLPTRLLDIGDDTSRKPVRLVETNSLKNSDRARVVYVALSYCWGPPEIASTQLRTTLDNYDLMREEIPKTSMSQTLVDTIRVCRAFRIRYLWIDALCIIQDSQEDWELESMQMAHIYEHSIFTACAWSSTSCQESFLIRNRRLVDIDFHSHLAPTIKGKFSLIYSGYAYQDSPESSLDDAGWPSLDEFKRAKGLASRGWTLQEKEMSPRKICFGTSMVHWQCGHTKSENGLVDVKATGNMLDLLEDPGSRWKHRLWQNMLGDFCDRKLTYATDRLPALSGMAKALFDKTNDRYLAGLWEDYLPESLLWWAFWKVDRPSTVSELVEWTADAEPYIAPSWSPLSSQSIISFLQDLNRGQYVKAEIDMLEANVDVQGLNPFGVIRSGYLKLRGRIFMLDEDHRFEKDESQLAIRPNTWTVQTNRGILANFDLDWWPPYEADTVEAEGTIMLAILSDVHPRNLPSGQQAEDDWMGETGTNEQPIHQDQTVSDDAHPVQDSPHEAHKTEAEQECAIEEKRDVFGLLLFPSREEGKYYRVGLWRSLFSQGYGKTFFDQFETGEVVII